MNYEAFGIVHIPPRHESDLSQFSRTFARHRFGQNFAGHNLLDEILRVMVFGLKTLVRCNLAL